MVNSANRRLSFYRKEPAKAMSKDIALKNCKCGKKAKSHYNSGLYCGNDMCDECFEEMVNKCRERSW